MKNQQGVALIIVLVLLSVSLMLGLSSVHSALLGERLAGNYKAAVQAQMNAERAAANMWRSFSGDSPPTRYILKNELNLDGGFGWGDFKVFVEERSSSCSSLSVSNGLACYVSAPNGFKGKAGGEYVIAMGAVGDGLVAESMPVFVKLSAAVVAEAAISCIGEECSFSPGNGKSGPAVDGTDRYAEGEISGSHQPGKNPNGEDVAAIMMPDVDGGEGVERGGGIIGEEIYSPEEYEEYNKGGGGWEKEKDRIFDIIKNAVALARKGAEGFYYAGPGETVSPGSATGVAVIEGGTLDLGGNNKFTGLVVLTTAVLKNDEILYGKIKSSGTATIVGAILGKDFSYEGKGNPSVFYSSQAISQSSKTGLAPFRIESWQ